MTSTLCVFGTMQHASAGARACLPVGSTTGRSLFAATPLFVFALSALLGGTGCLVGLDTSANGVQTTDTGDAELDTVDADGLTADDADSSSLDSEDSDAPGDVDGDDRPDVDAEPEVDADPDVDAEPEVDADPDVDAEPEVDADPDVDAELDAVDAEDGSGETGVPCTTDSECAPYLCDTANGSRCFVACTDGSECSDDAVCDSGVCVEDEGPVFRFVAVVSTSIGTESLDSLNPGPDVDAISLRQGTRELFTETMWSSAVGAVLSAPLTGLPENVIGAPDDYAGPDEDCVLDVENNYFAMGGPGGFVVVSFGDDIDIVPGDTVKVYELAGGPGNCANIGVDRPDTFDIYIGQADAVVPAVVSGITGNSSWCRVGQSSRLGGLTSVGITPEVCGQSGSSLQCGDAGTECSDLVSCDDSGLTGHVCDAGCCVRQPIPESCINGDDDDGDGDTDCDDSDCAGTIVCQDTGCGTCPAGTTCVDGRGCLAPAASPLSYAPSSRWAYVSDAYVAVAPSAGVAVTEEQVRIGDSDGVCCFDFDGDGIVDNAAGSFTETLSAIAGDGRELVYEAIINGDIVGLVEYRSGFSSTGPASLHFFTGTNDVDGDGEPDQPYSTRADGVGDFLVKLATFGPRGSLAQSNRGTWNRATGLFFGTGDSPFVVFQPELVLGLAPSSLITALAGGEFTLGGSLTRTELRGVRIEAEFSTFFPNNTVNVTLDDVELGGLRIGGYVLLDDLFRPVAEDIEDCDCAVGTNSGAPPLLLYGEGAVASRPTQYGVRCNDTSFDAGECVADQPLCGALNLICGTVVPVLGAVQIADLDADGNGINDAMSFGAYLTLVPAGIAEDIFQP